MTRPNSFRNLLNRAISAPRFMAVSPQESPRRKLLQIHLSPCVVRLRFRVLGPSCLSSEQSSTLEGQTWPTGHRRRTGDYLPQSTSPTRTSQDSLVELLLRT